MKYTLQSMKYTVKNFLFMSPLAAIPALFLSVSTDQVALHAVLDGFMNKNLQAWNFYNLFCSASVLNFGTLKSIGFGLVGIVAIIICVSMLLAFMEKHMRFGKRTFNGIFSKINDNLLPTMGYSILVLAIYEIWALIVAALLFLASKITALWLAYTAIVLVMLGMHFALLYTINFIYLWLPCMQITGFKAAEALQYSNHLSAPVKWHIIVAQTISLFAVETLIFICVLFTETFVTFTVVSTILYAVLIMIYCSRMEIAYFDLDNLERRDLRRYY